MKLSKRKCLPCEGGVDPISETEALEFMSVLNKDWRLIDDKKIERDYRFVNFVHTMDFVNKVADLAEQEGHHPVMVIGYGTCKIELWTHALDALSENDFILASKIDKLL